MDTESGKSNENFKSDLENIYAPPQSDVSQNVKESSINRKEKQITEILAHPGKRFQGQFIDGLVTYLLGYFTFFILKLVITTEPAAYAGIAVGVMYFLFSDSFPNGQSVGKRLLGFSVVSKVTMLPCSPLQSFLRNITFPLGILDWIFIFFGAHQRLGDFFASTIVVKIDRRLA